MDHGKIALRAPVSAEKMEGWVGEQVDRLRRRGRPVGVRLGRLSRAGPEQGGDWVVEVDVSDRGARLVDDMALGAILTDFELLGLRPQLLVEEVPAREDFPKLHEAFGGAPNWVRPGPAVEDLSWPTYTLDPMERRN